MDVPTVAPILASGIGLATLCWVIAPYTYTQRRNLALERTKFVFEQSRHFDTDEQIQLASKIMYGFTLDFSTETFLQVMKTLDGTETEISNAFALENYLNFLWRIAYAYRTLRTIHLEDVDAFGFYFYLVRQDTRLREYCKQEGYEEIELVTNELEPIWRKADVNWGRTVSARRTKPRAGVDRSRPVKGPP